MTDKRNRKPLVFSGQELKTFRKNQAILYKKGLAKKGANAQPVTRYAVTKQKKFADVITGKVAVVKADKKTRAAYRDSGIFESAMGRLLVPRDDSRERVTVTKRGVKISLPLKGGKEERIVFPKSITDMQGVVNDLKGNGQFANMLEPGEQFGFRLYGHNSIKAYTDIEDLINDIERNYKALFDPDWSRAAYRHFVLIKFTGPMRELADNKKSFSSRGRKEMSDYARRKNAERQRAKLQRLKKNPEAYAAKKEKDARRKAIARQQKFFD